MTMLFETYPIPGLGDTFKFEKLHPRQLRWTRRDREDFFQIEGGKGLWLYIQPEVAAEILWNDDYSIKSDKKIAYIWSITISKKHQGKGYSKLLKQVLFNQLKNLGYDEVRGHARDGKSWENTRKMGAKLIETIDNYHETGEKYHYYKQKLK